MGRSGQIAAGQDERHCSSPHQYHRRANQGTAMCSARAFGRQFDGGQTSTGFAVRGHGSEDDPGSRQCGRQTARPDVARTADGVPGQRPLKALPLSTFRERPVLRRRGRSLPLAPAGEPCRAPQRSRRRAEKRNGLAEPRSGYRSSADARAFRQLVGVCRYSPQRPARDRASARRPIGQDARDVNAWATLRSGTRRGTMLDPS